MKYETTLMVKWSKRENDFVIQYPRRCDGSFLNTKLFSRRLIYDYLKYCKGDPRPYNEEVDFIEELERRGYDKTTLRFEIKLKTD